jgi:hypothetical protein
MLRGKKKKTEKRSDKKKTEKIPRSYSGVAPRSQGVCAAGNPAAAMPLSWVQPLLLPFRTATGPLQAAKATPSVQEPPAAFLAVTAPWFPGPVAAPDWLAATLGVMHGAPLLTDFTEFHVVCDKERLLI